MSRESPGSNAPRSLICLRRQVSIFAPGGIAFHGGSLTAWSHGCMHLTDANAHYYKEHLPVGAQVVVF